MACNEKRSKSRRYNKFEKSESTIQTKNLEISSNEPKGSDKRLIEEIRTSPRNMFNKFMHPPSSTANLANNRLQKLKQTLQTDLKNQKLVQLGEADSSPGKLNYNNNNSAQNRMNRVKKEIRRSSNNLGSDISSKSSSQDVATPNSTSVLKDNSVSQPQKPIKDHQSPLLKEKINCKRKLPESPLNSEDSPLAKKIHCGSNVPGQSISQVKTPTTNKTNSHKPKLSARILKIKTETDNINSHLTSNFRTNCSNSSDQLHEYISNPCTPHSEQSLHNLSFASTPNQDNSIEISKNPSNDLDITHHDNNNSKTFISQSLKITKCIKLNTSAIEITRQNKLETSLPNQMDKHKSTGINRVSTSAALKSSNAATNKNMDKTLCKETISAHNTPLLYAGNDSFDDKMAMTASWIEKSHQQYDPIYKIQDDVKEISPTTNVNLSNDSEEMEWSNAESDTYQDTPTNKNNLSIGDNSKTVESVKCKSDKKQQCLCIVVDTNVFISDLSKINDIINFKVTGPLQPLIYIPWMVITELDEIKDRSGHKSGNSSLKQKVYKAIKLINKWLSEENPRVKGQTICDMGNQIHIGAGQDDKIIGTCLQASEQYESVMLLSNDVNLNSKALINNIAVSSAREVIMKIMSKLVNNTKYQKIKQKMGMICSSIICEKAKEAYGDVWTKMDMMSNPPWSLGECMKRFRKYWTAVFQEKLMKQFLPTVDKLQQILEDQTIYISDGSDKYKEFVKLSLNLCIFLKDIEEYKGYIQNTINDIVKIG